MYKVLALLVKFFGSLIKLRNYISLESYPDFSDNTKAVFDELLRRKLNNKYKLIWFIDNNFVPDKCFITENVKFIKRYDYSLKGTIIKGWYLYHSKLLICSNVFFNKYLSKQSYLYLSHGVAIKDCSNHYYLPDKAYDATVITTSDYFKDNDSKNLHCKKENILSTGFPRNDILKSERIDLSIIFNDIIFDKVIYWLPTFRQHKGGLSVSHISIPLIHSANICDKLNDIARTNKTLIIIKPHFAQDTSKINNKSYSNIRFIDDNFLSDKGISNYELLGSSDALLTDYSSVYYDYLLCDKPIGLCWEDFIEYNKNEGFVDGAVEMMDGGEKIYTFEDLSEFIKSVYIGKDKLRDKRAEITKIAHKYNDANSTKRVVDYLEENIL